MTVEMIERVAKALCRVSAESYRADDVDGFVDRNWMPWTTHSRAAIAAMREPTEEMVIAGCRHENMGDMSGRWQAMIDVALGDKK